MGHEHPHHQYPHDHGSSGGHDEGLHGQEQGHSHTHGFVDPSIASTSRGLWALKWSFVGLLATALSRWSSWRSRGASRCSRIPSTTSPTRRRRSHSGSHSGWRGGRRPGASPTAWGASRTSRGSRSSLRSWPALVAAYEAVGRLLHPQPVTMLGAVMVASVIGFLGNEAVAVFRIRVGRQIGSAALVADGYHARVDGWTSLAVLIGALGVWAGYPLADPVVGLLISAAIMWLGAQAGRTVLVRILDGVDTETVEAVTHAAGHVPEVREVTDVRARWIGHRLHAELSVERVARAVRRRRPRGREGGAPPAAP